MNRALLSVLDEIRDVSALRGSVYREKAYRKAMAEIAKLDFVVDKTSIDAFQRRKTPGIGPGIMSKIVEFVTTGRVDELVEARRSPLVTAYREFTGIAGVGPATIDTWVKMGVTSLAMLRRAVAKGDVTLNHMQQHGLRHYDDLNSRIPRAEVTALSERMYAVIQAADPRTVCLTVGSYRRGAADSGDIDIMTSRRDRFNPELLGRVLEAVAGDKHYVDTLSHGAERVTFLYRSPVSGRVRQIDVLNLPYERYWAGVLYFTGSHNFNVNMRGWAKAHGYRLNQNGLFRVGKQLRLVPTVSERDIFKVLKLKYLEPCDRTEKIYTV